MRTTRSLLIWALVAVATTLWLGFLGFYGEPSALTRDDANWRLSAEAAAFPGFESGQARAVLLDVPPAENVEETAEQARDLLLLSIVTAGLPADATEATELADAAYQFSPLRRGYSDTTTQPQTGIARLAARPDGAAVLLLPEGLTADERHDEIARAADTFVVRFAEQPTRMFVFEYCLSSPDSQGAIASATLRLVEIVRGAELFSPAFGFVMVPVYSAGDVSVFLEHADDLVGVDTRSENPTLTGRAYRSRSYGRVTLEHLATIWSAYAAIDVAESAQSEQLGRLLERLTTEGLGVDEAWLIQAYSERNSCGWKLQSAIFRNGDASILPDPAARASMLATPEPIRQTVVALDDEFRNMAEERESLLRGGVGFSLDQGYDPQRLARSLASADVSPALNAHLRIARRLFADELAHGDASGLLCSLEVLGLTRQQSQSLSERLFDSARYQYARYDGGIFGTEVGEILFYTDLLAKLWSMDFDGSFQHHFPRQVDAAGDDLASTQGEREHVRLLLASLDADTDATPLNGGFTPTVYGSSPVQYQAQELRLPGTRIWFDIRDEAVSDRDGQLSLLPTAVRVFARSRDVLSEEREEQPTFLAAQFVDWFNRRYEATAAADPRYDQLNQIIKWSLALDRLRESYSPGFSTAMDSVEVRRDLWFPDWAAGLFSESERPHWIDCFHERGRYRQDVETMPVMHVHWPNAPTDFWCAGAIGDEDRLSYSINGGVSTPRWGRLVQRNPELAAGARQTVPMTARRSGLQAWQLTEGGGFRAQSSGLYTWRINYEVGPAGNGAVRVSRHADIMPVADEALSRPTIVYNRGTAIETARAETSELISVTGNRRADIASFAAEQPVARTTIEVGDDIVIRQRVEGLETAGALASDLASLPPSAWLGRTLRDPRVAAAGSSPNGGLRVWLKNSLDPYDLRFEIGDEASLVNIAADADARASRFVSFSDEVGPGVLVTRAEAATAPSEAGAGMVRVELDMQHMDNGAQAIMVRGPPVRSGGPPGGSDGGGFGFGGNGASGGGGSGGQHPFHLMFEDHPDGRRLILLADDRRINAAISDLASLDIDRSLVAGAPTPRLGDAAVRRSELARAAEDTNSALRIFEETGDLAPLVGLRQSHLELARDMALAGDLSGAESILAGLARSGRPVSGQEALSAVDALARGVRIEAPSTSAARRILAEIDPRAMIGPDSSPFRRASEFLAREPQLVQTADTPLAPMLNRALGLSDPVRARARYLDELVAAAGDDAVWRAARVNHGRLTSASVNGRIAVSERAGMVALEPRFCRTTAAQPIDLGEIADLTRTRQVFIEQRALARMQAPTGGDAPRFVRFSFAPEEAILHERAALVRPDTVLWGPRLTFVRADGAMLASNAARGAAAAISLSARVSALRLLAVASLSGFGEPLTERPPEMVFISDVLHLPGGCSGPDLLAQVQ